MRKLLSLLMLLGLVHAAYSQSTSIKGFVKDTVENRNLPHAVVTLLRGSDSVLVKFTRTDNQGQFNLSNLDAGSYVLMVTYPKFADYTDKIELKAGTPGNLGIIPLTPTSVLLNEVVVRANNTMRIKGDTTEFTADSFKVKPGATVEDLLKVIPGMQVNAKGEVTAQGKRVDKVLVDGEEFFGDDPTIATQNISAKAVDKVQVYETKTEQDQLKGIGSTGDGNKTINIKLKEDAKRGYFGKVEGGTNFDNLNDAKLMLNKFKGSEKISIYGTKSNTNTGSLGWEDQGKLGIDDEDDYEYDEIGGFYYSFGSGDNEYSSWNLKGLPTAYTAGALYANKWRQDKNKLNLSYLYNRLGTTNNSYNLSQTLLEDTTFYNNSNSRSKGLSQQHSAKGKYEWKIDSLASIKFNIAALSREKTNRTESYSEALNEDQQFVNNNNRINDLLSKKKQLDNTITYKQLFKKKNRQLTATFRLGLVDDESTGLLTSTTNFYKNGNIDSIDVTDQQKINTGKSRTIGTKITYNEPITDKWNLVAEYSLNQNVSESHNNSYDKALDGKYSDFNPTFSNNFDLDALSNSGTLTARYMGKKLRLAFGSGVSAIRLNLDNLGLVSKTHYNFTGLTPQFQLGYKLKTQTGVSFSYRGNTVQPTLNQLQPLRNNTDPLSIYVGNPDLRVGFNHNLNFNFNDYKTLKGQYLFVNVGMNFNQHAITNYSSVDEFGKTTYMPINVNGNRSWYMWSAFNTGQGEKKLIHEISPQANGGRNVNYINGKENVNTYTTLVLQYSIRYNIQEKLNVSIGPSVSRNISESSLRPTANNNYWTYGGRANLYVKLPGGLDLDSDVQSNLRQKTSAFPNPVNITVWNASLGRTFFKNKNLRLSFVAHDILNQNIGFNRTINSNFVSEQRYDQLAQYFMFNIRWTFTKMPGMTKQ